MFEFHGWATVRVDDRDDPDMSVIRHREKLAVEQLQLALKEADDDFSLFELKQIGNGLIVLLAHGLRNHRYEPVIELFRWLAWKFPDSYGLLYCFDDESEKQSNEFRVLRLCLGKSEELSDPFLSPYFPTVELPLEG